LKWQSFWLARALFAASFLLASGFANAADGEEADRCSWWWQFGRCDASQEYIEGLPPEAPREGVVITVDLSRNQVYLFEDGQLIRKSLAATGSEKTLKKGNRVWLFRTPRGRHTVLRKVVNPIWRKPDWAFVEEGLKVPPAGSPQRSVKGELGKYALDLGDGIMIHGTRDRKSIGKKVSHGCIRLPDDMLLQVYKAARVGTEVHIFESEPPPQYAQRESITSP
jgi:hypothetical protein